jgi:hypothetical protein
MCGDLATSETAMEFSQYPKKCYIWATYCTDSASTVLSTFLPRGCGNLAGAFSRKTRKHLCGNISVVQAFSIGFSPFSN